MVADRVSATITASHMPLAAKKNTRTEKVTPAQIDVEPLPHEEIEEIPQPPKVTALVWSYNNAPALRQCLSALERSVPRQAIEIVVVDKGSQDESPGLDAEFPETTFLRLPRNFGNTKALNIAMRTGIGELVFFMRPEVIVAPDTVERLVQTLEADSDAVALCPLIVDESGAAVEQVYRLPTPQTGAQPVAAPMQVEAEGPAVVEYATFQAMLARKYFIRGINYLDERFGEFGADAEVSFQIRRAGRSVKLDPRVKVIRLPIPMRNSGSAETLLLADRIHGTAVYLSKHFGFFSGFTLRIVESLKALAGLKFSLFTSLVSGTKVDGSQSVTL